MSLEKQQMFIFKYLIKCPCTLTNVHFLVMVCIEASYGKNLSLRLRCLGRAGRVDERGGSGGGEGQADDSDGGGKSINSDSQSSGSGLRCLGRSGRVDGRDGSGDGGGGRADDSDGGGKSINLDSQSSGSGDRGGVVPHGGLVVSISSFITKGQMINFDGRVGGGGG